MTSVGSKTVTQHNVTSTYLCSSCCDPVIRIILSIKILLVQDLWFIFEFEISVLLVCVVFHGVVIKELAPICCLSVVCGSRVSVNSKPAASAPPSNPLGHFHPLAKV